MFNKWMNIVYVLWVITIYAELVAGEAKNVDGDKEGRGRAGKLLSMFQIVTFANEACAGGTKNGTCYTANECANKRGINAGTCAQGYGVCCTFTISCGSTSSQNCTYIESNGVTAGACMQSICPATNNICQLRLDFNMFVIAGPSTSTNSLETSILNGLPVFKAATGVPNSFASRCLTDTFEVTNTGGTNPAPICGTNSGQHMYVDVDQSGSSGCNNFVFQLGTVPVFTTIPTRQWSIKVTQYDCDSPSKAPSGCTQYYFNSADIVKTYNFDGGQHLADQRQTICVRRTRGNCRICWTAMNLRDFAVSGFVIMNQMANMGSALIKSTICCGVGMGGKNMKGYDCVQIPGALKITGSKVSKAMLTESRFCGRDLGLGTKSVAVTMAGNGANRTICSTVIPFYIRFISDGFEVTGAASIAAETSTPNKGFRLAYKQDANMCV